MKAKDEKTVGLSQVSDRELMTYVQEGNLGAFDELAERYKVRLFNFIYRVLPEKEEAEDILQETFLRAYRERKRFDQRFCFSTWIYTIALNLARSEYRRRKRWKMVRLGTSRNEGELELPDEKSHQEGFMPFIEKAVETLPPEYREAFVLRDVNRLPYEDIAQILSVPVGTVKSRINRARLLMRERLEPLKESIYELSKGLPESIRIS